MGLKTLAPIVLFVLLAFTFGVRAQQSGTSAAPSSAWNDNFLIKVQKDGGDATRSGDVKIEFYGHDAFKITSPAGLTVLTDPWRNDPTGLYPNWFLNEFPALRVDIVLSTHAHFDHDAVERPNGLMVLERLIGQFKLGDIEIMGLADKHQCDSTLDHKSDRASADFHVETYPPNNVIGFDNAIQIIETGGLRISIWGDNRGVPDPSLDRYLKNVDVLILPVETILTRAETDAIVQKYDPKAVIPAHYFLNGLTTDLSGLESADGWVNDQQKVHHADVRRLDSAGMTLNAAELKGSHHRVYYFGNHFEKKWRVCEPRCVGMSVDLNRAAMLESNSPRFESLIAQTAAQELWTWTPGPVAGLRCLNSQDSRQCCRRFQHALHTCFASTSPRSKPSILCSAFLMFSTISGNLLLARSKSRHNNWVGFWYSWI